MSFRGSSLNRSVVGTFPGPQSTVIMGGLAFQLEHLKSKLEMNSVELFGLSRQGKLPSALRAT